MKEILQKARVIFVPFALIAVGFVVVYSLLKWLIVIECGLPLQDELVDFWLPFAAPWLPILIWLRPRLRALKFKWDNSLFFFELVAALVISVPTIFAQSYLNGATGKLTSVDRVSQIHLLPATKYYSLKLFYADKSRAKLATSLSSGTRASDPPTATALFVLPMRDSVDDLQLNCDVWMVSEYKTQLTQRGSAAIEQEFRNFVQNSPSQLNTEDLRSFSYWEKLGMNDERRLAEAAIHKSNLCDSLYSPIILTGAHQPFELRNAGKLPWAFGILGGGATLWFLMLLFPKINEVELRRIQRGHPSAESSKEILSSFLSTSGLYITPILISLNILVFIAMLCAGLGVISFRASDLLKWGANYGPSVLHGQWFRLVTSLFVHGGLPHLFANLSGLLFAGLFLERTLGKIKFTIAYFVTGIAAGITSICIHPQIVSVGASGAIFGLYGILLVLLLVKDIGSRFFKDRLLLGVVIFIIANFVIGSVTVGVDNAAHLGGLLSGMLVGALLSLTAHLKPVS